MEDHQLIKPCCCWRVGHTHWKTAEQLGVSVMILRRGQGSLALECPHSDNLLKKSCCGRRSDGGVSLASDIENYTSKKDVNFSVQALPFTVGVTGGRLVLRTADEAAVASLYCFCHRVPCLAARTPLHPRDAEVWLEEQMEPAVRQQQRVFKNTKRRIIITC